MTAADLVGYAAGTITTIANLPQVVITYQRRSGEGLSFRMLMALAIGLLTWCIYGVMTKAWPIVITNGIAVLLVISLLVMKFRFDRKPTKD